MNPRAITAFILLLLLSPCVAPAADEWPQFRGPGGQGISDAKGVPLTWSESANVKWKTAIPGEGWSSPVVSGNQIWMTTGLSAGKSRHAVGVDLESGKILRDIEVFAVEAPQGKNALNSFASPTPVIEGNRLYVHFGSDGTACIDTDSGKILWQNRALKINHAMGAGSSPILYKDKLLFCSDGMDFQYMAALNKNTGEIAWKTPRSQKFLKAPIDKHKSFATPLVIQVDGKDQLISPAAEFLYSYEPDSGKELWFVRYPGYSNVPRPVYGHGLLFIGTGFDRAELWAIKPGGSGDSGDLSKTNVAWMMKIQAPLQPSPVLAGDYLFTVSDSGAAKCIDPKTGNDVWRQSLAGEFSASPLFADGRVYFFDRAGVTTVVEPATTFKQLAKNTLDSGFMASPAVVGKALILRTKQSLYRIEEN